MTEQELKEYWGEQVKIRTNDNHEVTGFAAYFSDAYDNDPEPASLGIETEIGLIGVDVNEIASIEVIK